MQNYILYSDVDQQIIDEMANQAPDVSKRLRAINSELNILQAAYDLFDTVRKKTVSIITDGSTAYNLATLVPDNDVKSIKGFLLPGTDNLFGGQFTYLDHPAFKTKYSAGVHSNYFTIYTEDGIQYLKVGSIGNSDTVESVDMLYFTTHKALDENDDFIPEVINANDVKILLPKRFTELVSLGALTRLHYPAVGEDQQATLKRFEKRYDGVKNILGLTVASTPQRISRKVQYRKLW